MCTAPNFVYLTAVDKSPAPKCKKLKRTIDKKEYISIVDDGVRSIYHYSFIPHGSYDKVMAKDPSAINRLIPVPCGKCLECRIQYARMWADRCALEAKKYQHNYFITLTYDDAHRPERNSLRPRDMTLFIKRIRKKFGKDIKYLYSGEYGDSSWKPHYHIIFFNLPLNDLSFDFVSYEDGLPHKHSFNHGKGLMYSKTIHDLWYDEDDHTRLGNISVASFTYDTAAYVSQYVTKKCGKDLDSVYKKLNIVPEFIRMSKGIAEDSFDEAYFDEFDHIVIPGDGHVASLPRYFQKLYLKNNETLSPEKLARRYKRQEITKANYLHSRNFDRQAEIREYELKVKQKLRAAI